MFCVAGAFPPCACVKVRDAGAAEIVPAETTSCTLIVAGLPVAEGDVTVTVPLYVPGASADPFAVTVIGPGVEPLAGETVNQFPPVLAAAAAVQLSPAPPLVTLMVCGCGAAPP